MSGLILNWPPPPAQRELRGSQIHVWAASLQPLPAQLSAWSNSLSPDEQVRAARFHFERDRDRFIAARGFLRAVLAGYTRLDSARLEFVYGPKGKPALAEAYGGAELFFNLAHSDDLALVAVTRLGNLGIDVERLRPVSDAEGIAARFFSARETAGWRALPEGERDLAFFNLWTRKEALLKATGEGIGESLGAVEVAFLPGEPARLIRWAGDEAMARTWSLLALNPASDFVGALAVPAIGVQVDCWRWPG